MPLVGFPSAARRNPIEEVAVQIQSLEPAFRWLYAQPDVILHSATGAGIQAGRGSRAAQRFVEMCAKLDLEHVAVGAATVLLLLAVWAKQFTVQLRPGSARQLFVGISSLRDPHLLRQFEESTSRTSEFIDERFLSAFYAVHRISLADLWQEFRAVWSELYPGIRRSRHAAFTTGLLLNYLLRYGFRHVFFRTWFRRVLADGYYLQTMAFSAASDVAYAAIAAGVSATFMPHGFLWRPNVYPEFDRVVSFNRFDADHIRIRLPRALVETSSYKANFLTPTSSIAVIGVNFGEETYDLCKSLIMWATQYELAVVIRPHPADHSGYWDGWQNARGVQLAEDACDFDTFLTKYRPKIVASWHSTVLFDAVVRGVVPVTLEVDAQSAAEVVFPFQNIALLWPEQKQVVQQLAKDPGEFHRFVIDNYTNVFGSSPAQVES
jgi:hypothetical protein